MHLYSVGLCIVAFLAMHSWRVVASVSVIGTCRGMALVKFAAPCITAQFALLHDGSDGKNVANVGIVQNSRKKMSKIQKNVQK